MKKMILMVLVFTSLIGYSQSIKNASCGASDFNYVDASNNYSICIPKHFNLKHTGHGVIFEDSADVNNQIFLEAVTNAGNKSLLDWTNNMQRSLSKGATPPTFKVENHNIGTGVVTQRIIATYKSGAQTNIIFVPLAKDYSKVLLIMFIEYPDSKSIRDILFSTEVLLMQFSFKWLL